MAQCLCVTQSFRHARLKCRNHVAIKPGMALQPGRVAPGRVRQNDDRFARDALRCKAKALDGCRQALTPEVRQMVVAGITADQKRQIEGRASREKPIMPGFAALAARRQITTLGVQPRKAKPHGNDGQKIRIIEPVLIHAQPSAKTVARRVRERPAGGVHAGAGRLAAHKKARRAGKLQDGARIMRQAGAVAWRLAAQAAMRDTLQKVRKRR